MYLVPAPCITLDWPSNTLSSRYTLNIGKMICSPYAFLEGLRTNPLLCIQRADGRSDNYIDKVKGVLPVLWRSFILE